MKRKKATLSQIFCAKIMKASEKDSEKFYKKRKKRLFSKIKNKSIVLEIGPGTGINLSYYPRGIKWIGIEPNQEMHKFLREKAQGIGVNADLKEGISEKLEIKSNSVDYVISTLVLCSVNNLFDTLKEIKRVLKKGGKFIFIEHVAGKKGTLRCHIQKIMPLTPWRFFSNGCDPARNIEKAIKEAGFSRIEIENYMQKGKGIIHLIAKPHISGLAVK